MAHTLSSPQEKKDKLFHMLPMEIRTAFERGTFDFSMLQEIRMRVGCPLLVVYGGEEYLVAVDGQFEKDMGKSILVSAGHIRETMEYISNYSMYAFEEEIRQGYLTIIGGHRVGLAGKVVWERGAAKSMRHISFLNIRLAHEIKGCADGILPCIYGGTGLCHTLIISPPGCGKTTLLRDLIRQVSEGNAFWEGMTVGVVDERSEIGACYQGRPQNDLGCRTDVLDGCPKREGMMMLVRSMAPQVIAVDEIGTAEDAEMIRYVMNCGVRMLATVHGASLEEIGRKPALERLIGERAFERYIILEPGEVGKVQAVLD